MNLVEAERIAQEFHETYERFAPLKEGAAVPWREVSMETRNLMTAVVFDLLQRKVIKGDA